MRHRHPEAEVTIRHLDLPAARGALLEGDVDAVVTRLPFPSDGLHVTVLYEEPRVLVVPRDHRFAGTWEVLIPVEGRNKPLRAPRQFDNQQAAEAWMHSPDGKDTIAEMGEEEEKVRK